MRSTTLTALALTLLMLLLVLLAAFVFVFQGQLTLRDDLLESSQTVDAVEAERAKLELQQFELLATATRLSAVQATSASESVELSKQLAAADLEGTRLAEEQAMTAQERDAIRATRDGYESSGPVVTIVEPRPPATATAGEELTVVVVASDVVDIRSVTLSINNELIDSPPISPARSIVLRHTWTPEEAGQAIITVTAVNNNNVTSQPAAITVPVLNPTASATIPASPTATTEATATPQ